MTDFKLTPVKKPFLPVDFEKTILWPWKRCKVRILIVTESGIDFGPSGFGLEELITKALNTSSRPYVDFVITKASRAAFSTGADLLNFRFDNSQAPAPAANKAFNNTNYDQVWLFGIARSPALPLPERLALINFMNAGGGVFATGDHEDLGEALCAEIPRVRSMRKWYWPTAPAGRLVAPDGSSANRLDTTVVGDTPGYQFSDQSDETPQNIIPRYFTVGSAAVPHPLLSKTGGVIKVLPDHAHEGECVVPTVLTEKVVPGDARDEYPMALDGSGRVTPQLVAISYSGAGYLTDVGKPAVNPRCFGAISAYDGHLAGVGRVSVDATWHHFLNINLMGFSPGSVASPEYEDIKQYFRNIALWLSPVSLQKCFRFRLIYYVRYQFPLIWEIRKNPDAGWKDLLHTGRETRKMIEKTIHSAEVLDTARSFLEFGDSKNLHPLHSLLSTAADEAAREKLRLPLLSEDTIIDAILGGVIQNIADKLPEFPQEVAEVFSTKSDDKALEALITDGVTRGLSAISALLSEQSAKTKEFGTLLKR